MNSSTVQRDARIDAGVMLGRNEIHEPIFNFMGQRSVIGYQILKHFAITFDQGEKTVRFARSGTQPITIESRYTAGFGAKPTTDGRVVWYALDGLPAAQAGLKEGDLIVAANGKPMSDYDVQQWRTMFEKPGTIQLEVRRDGSMQQITFDVLLAVQ
jgi:S1-C subfamily serine protease